MTESTPRVGVAHPTVVPANHRQRNEPDGRDGETTERVGSA
ncbi:hypothetical protein [Halobellus ruber]|nr:hypothetical protein [Halobellus ruber]